MVLSKAVAWYDHVLKPLQRLTSVTTNALSAAHRQQGWPTSVSPRATSPAKLSPTINQGIRSDSTSRAAPLGGWKLFDSEINHLSHSQQSYQQLQEKTWRAFIQNPLDVILSESQAAPGHPVQLFSQPFHKPFSTSAADQARRQPGAGGKGDQGGPAKQQTPGYNMQRTCTKLRRPGATRSPKPPGASSNCSARDREVGAKKYRKINKNKNARKGPHLNTRRQRRVNFKKIDAADLDASSLAHTTPALANSAASAISPLGVPATVGPNVVHHVTKAKTGRKNAETECIVETPRGFPAERSKSLRQTFRHWIGKPFAFGRNAGTTEAVSFKKNSNRREMCRLGILESSTEYTTLADRSRRDKSTLNSSGHRAASHLTGPNTAGEKAPFGHSSKVGLSDMSINLQDAVTGFKCSLWKKAVTVDTSFRCSSGMVDYAPCYSSIKKE